MLTGKHESMDKLAEGRYKGRDGKENKGYQARYWKPQFFEAMRNIKAACEAEGAGFM